MSFYWKARTMISGDYRELERNMIAYRNERVIAKYAGKEPIYCVIRLFTDEGGLFCIFLKALAGISYSIQHGYIPVIDMQTKVNIFLDSKQRRQTNAWELFFKQPSGVSFAEIKDKPNHIVLENPLGPSNLFELVHSPEVVQYWRALCHKYIQYQDEVEQLIVQYSHMFGAEDRVFGVLARGTDYLNPGVGHPMQPTVEDVIAQVRQGMAQHHCNKIFLATEDDAILLQMKTEFGDNLYFVDQKRYQGEQKDKLGHLADYKSGAIAMNRSYLTAIHYLSRCCCFFGGVTTGTVGVYLMGDDFEDFQFWYRGTYGISDVGTLDISKL